jgi:hypothetical protein
MAILKAYRTTTAEDLGAQLLEEVGNAALLALLPKRRGPVNIEEPRRPPAGESGRCLIRRIIGSGIR